MTYFTTVHSKCCEKQLCGGGLGTRLHLAMTLSLPYDPECFALPFHRVSSLQASLKEKDAMLQVLQASLLEPEDGSPDDFLYPSRDSPMKPFNGSLLSLNSGGSSASSVGEIPAQFSSSPPTKLREFGAHNGGYMANGMMFGRGPYHQVNSSHTEYGLPLVNGHGPNTRYLGPTHSKSAPNTPRTCRPRSSHPNMVMAADVGPSSAPSSVLSSPANHKKRKVKAKSRTPPPNYHIVGAPQERQKRRSVDGLLDGADPSPNISQSSQNDLFDSLFSNGLSPHLPGHTHRHSKSSPSSHKLL